MPPQQNNITHYDVIIVGAGAAGLFCAFTAANRGKRILVLEKSNKVGKKILMSGGGRCNFTNYTIEPEHFISSNPHFFKAALKRYSQWDFIALVDKHGIEFEERKHTQLFCKHSAKDILNMLHVRKYYLVITRRIAATCQRKSRFFQLTSSTPQ